MLTVRYEVLPHARDLGYPPQKATPGSAGFDLRAAVDENGAGIPVGGIRLIPTGLRIAVPRGYEAQIRPRSGLALKKGVTVLNSPGTIDSDYRGEIGVVLVNHGTVPVLVKRGERIAQMVFCRVRDVEWTEGGLDHTTRGEGGFGSTGSGVPQKMEDRGQGDVRK